MDFIAGRGYAIGDDGTALRTDDGGATLDRPGHRHVAGPDRLQVGHAGRRSSSSAATAASCAAPTTAARPSASMFVLAETNCPDPVAASYFVDPAASATCCCATATCCAPTDGGQTFGRGTAVPGTPASAGGGQAHRPPTRSSPRPTPASSSSTATNAAFKTTDAGASWTPRAGVEPGSVSALHAVSATTFYAFGPDTLLRSTDGGADLAAPRGRRRQRRSPAISCATDDLCLLSTDRRRPAAAHRGRRRDRRRRSRPHRADLRGRLRQRRPARSRGGAGGATVVSDDGGVNYAPVGGDIARLVPVRPAARARRRRSRSRSAPAASSPARPTTASPGRRSTSPTSADMQDTSFTDADNGYALDQRGGLFRTANGGASWQPIDPGTTVRAAAVIATGARRPAGRPARRPPRGRRRRVRRSSPTAPARAHAVDQFDRGGSAIFAYGATAIVRTHQRRQGSGRQVKGPRASRARDRRAAAARRRHDVGATAATRSTPPGACGARRNGGKRWTELPASAPTAASRSRSAAPPRAT